MLLTVPPEPDYSAAPTAEDVERKITGANWWPQDEGQIALARYAAKIAVNGATKRFLKLVRWEPFVSSGNSETRHFRVIDEAGCIQLGDGLLQLESLKVMGRPYTLNSTAFLMPENALRQQKPYTAIELYPANVGYGGAYGGWGDYGNGGSYPHGPRHLRPHAIEVTGVWGYCTSWPEDAFEAIVSTAGRLALAAVNQESELSGISEDGFSEQYDLVGPIDQKTALNQWGVALSMSLKEVADSYAKRTTTGATTLNVGASATRNARFDLPRAN